MISNITVVGGTHGNELSGLQLVQNWQRLGIPTQYSHLNIHCMVANTDAVEANTRFIEEDLNRQFSPERLNSTPHTKEAKLAHKINENLGPKGNSNTDLVIDIHNTTSAMGATLIILETDDFHVQLARFVKHVMPEANILVEDEKTPQQHPYLCTVGKRGVMIEVGAQPQGLLRADVYALTEKLAFTIFKFVTLFNNHNVPNLPVCDCYRFIENIGYPLDKENNRLAAIHPQLQDQDFIALNAGSPIFTHFDGTEVVWEGDTIYPHFVNEAAYHKLHIAFASATKHSL